MKDIDQALRTAAADIDPELTPALRRRLAAALARAEQRTKRMDSKRVGRPAMPKFAFGFVLATAAVVTVLLVWPPAQRAPKPVVGVMTATTASYSGPVSRLSRVIDSQDTPEARLEEEFRRLNADWRRIQSGVRDQLQPLL